MDLVVMLLVLACVLALIAEGFVRVLRAWGKDWD
jgi:hypothetical protein